MQASLSLYRELVDEWAWQRVHKKELLEIPRWERDYDELDACKATMRDIERTVSALGQDVQKFRNMAWRYARRNIL